MLMWIPRARSDYRHVVVCYTVLEQGQQTGAVLASRGVPVCAEFIVILIARSY